ncbi:hypothetical protein [Halorubrum sp. Boch-26]|uniref:hypothetical protein n=1 Tax=Halorubrum sp. Boch-26 TaxID=2994426 RepID=UPI002469088F|nr:hypothetical protein [Halorubrum sp. Boch-26]
MSDGEDGTRRDSDADEEEDALESLDDPETEIDDPFVELGASVDGDGFEGSGSVDPDTSDFDTDDVDPDTSVLGSDPSSLGSASDAGHDDPFDELGPPDSETDLDDAFERMDVGGPAAEGVWELLDADTGDGEFDSDAEVGGGTAVPGEGDTEHVVAKRTYCQQCPHFTPPPEVACAHDGTTIVEVIGFDQLRVRNCPMIGEENPTFDSNG